jgi:hypothetical membrane protein
VSTAVLLVGSTVGAALNDDYDSLRESVSTLAALDMPHRWVMVATFAVVGLAHIVTASSLARVGVQARRVLALAGVGTLAAAVVAIPVRGELSIPHLCAVLPTMLLYASWPMWCIVDTRVWALRDLVSRWAARVFVALLLGPTVTWFVGTDFFGLAERVALVSTMWPAVVAVSVWLSLRDEKRGRPEPGGASAAGAR